MYFFFLRRNGIIETAWSYTGSLVFIFIKKISFLRKLNSSRVKLSVLSLENLRKRTY